jgi:hypothetical protein
MRRMGDLGVACDVVLYVRRVASSTGRRRCLGGVGIVSGAVGPTAGTFHLAVVPVRDAFQQLEFALGFERRGASS